MGVMDFHRCMPRLERRFAATADLNFNKPEYGLANP